MSNIQRIGRRHFLAGSAGVLAVPFLGSLAPRRAKAQSTPQLRLVVLGTNHGGVWPENMFPQHGPETVQTMYGPVAQVPQHDVRWSSLSERVEGGRAILSEVLQADAGVLTSDLVRKLSVIGGVDISTYIGHNRAAFTGNFGANDQGESLHGLQVQTIDQLVARHPDFNKNPVKERSLHYGEGYGVSSNVRFSASAARVNGKVVPVQATSRPRDLWNRLFADVGGDGNQTPVVDLVHEQYRSLTRGAFGEARRLSRSDRDRLEAHLTMISELQRKLNTTVTCDAVSEPPNDSGVEGLRRAADLFVAALRCGASNVGVMTAAGGKLSPDDGWTNWHEQIAHNGGGDRSRDSFNPEFQRINYRAHRRFFEEVFLRIASGLDVEESDGQTFLDRTLLLWSMESGDQTHVNFSMPVVTAGSAGGFFETGRYVDYRNYGIDEWVDAGSPNRHPGILLNRVLGNVLQSMGVAPADYHTELQQVQREEYDNGARGYGVVQYHRSNFWAGADLQTRIWPRHHFDDGDVLLPGWVRGA